MRKLILVMMIALGALPVVFGQKTMAKDPKAEAQIIALEKAGWEAWKNKNAAWFQTNLVEDFLDITSSGVTSKAEVVRSISIDCDVKSVALDNFKFVLLTKDVAVMTYTARQEAVCGGQKVPSQVRSTVNYVRRGGKWLEAMYMETAMSRLPL